MTTMPTIPSRARLGLAACILVLLAACGEENRPFGNAGTRNATGDGPAPIGATRLVERDIEAPEVFNLTQEGLWDGRPSLGGVWVAHPTADDPERVIIRNEENGRFVIGALFRREHDNPGPALMISSDAAAALNILAGDPTQVQVTALRREEVADPAPAAEAGPEAEVTLAAAQGTAITSSAITATPLGDPIAAAAAAISEAEIAAGVASAGPAQVPDSAPAAAAAPRATAAAPAAAAASAPTPTPASSSLSNAFVQIGIFSVQENANNTGQALRNAGLAPTIYDQSTNGRRFWRVVVGPAQTAAERDAMLNTVRGLGFADAYAVTR